MRIRSLCMLVAVLGAAGCASVINAARPPRQGQFPMPDLRGKTESGAKETLALEGKTGSVDVQKIDCKDEAVKEGTVCNQTPEPGQTTQAGGPTVVYIQAKRNPKMPNLVGKLPEEARKILADVGFQDVDVRVLERTRKGCLPKRICVTSPEAGVRASLKTQKTLWLPPDEDLRPTPTDGPPESQPPPEEEKPEEEDKPPESVF